MSVGVGGGAGRVSAAGVVADALNQGRVWTQALLHKRSKADTEVGGEQLNTTC